MFFARHPVKGVITAEDAELDVSLRSGLTCESCGVPISFVGTYIRNETYVSHFFRLKKGMKNHFDVNGEICKYAAKSNVKIKLPTSKIHGVITDKDLKVRINIPVHLKKSLMDRLSNDLIPIKKRGEPKMKKSPGEYEKSRKTLSDYINSAKALSKIAHEWEKDKDINYMEFSFDGKTAKWMDIYFENWDKVYEKFPSRFPTELIVMRGTLSSIGKLPIDNDGYSWLEIVLKKKPITENIQQLPKTFARIKLYEPMFRVFIRDIEKLVQQKKKIEITFFGKFERFLNNNDNQQNIKGIAVLRKQIHYQVIK
jgi:hypothetical protein